MREAQHVAKQDFFFICIWESGRIYPTSSNVKKIEALSKSNTSATRARETVDARQAGDNDTAFYNLELPFGGLFPAR